MPEEAPTAWATTHEFVREGPRQERLRAHAVLEEITERTCSWIGEQDQTQPFFCYMPLTAPHTPISPAPAFLGASGINPYADFCMEVDHRLGQVMQALEAAGVADETIVVFTTDNGASAGPSECAALEQRYGHFCSYRYRGYKSDIWDGGHRLPFLVRWPDAIAPGTVCQRTVGLFDLFATMAEIVGVDVADNAGEDSVSFLPDLRGDLAVDDPRLGLVHHSIDGRFALRSGPWKVCRCPGSGGWSLPDSAAREQGLPEVQLYNLDDDPGERHNLAGERPEIVADLTQRLHHIVTSGSSRLGVSAPQVGEPGGDMWGQVDWICELPERFIADD